ncbi:hypothetical protein FACS1894184_18020 [Clostridia bacterium]|nr:hypothetical protein FACS1894184_18020 [Clostridia bacterium]
MLPDVAVDDIVVSAVHDPQLLAFVLSEYCISYPVIGLSVPAAEPDQVIVIGLSATVAERFAVVGAVQGDIA